MFNNSFFKSSFLKISFLIFVFSFFINTNITKADTATLSIPSDDTSVNTKLTRTEHIQGTDGDTQVLPRGTYYITVSYNLNSNSNVITIEPPTDKNSFGGYYYDTSNHNLIYQNATIVGTFSTTNFTLPTQNFTSYNPPNTHTLETSFNNTNIVFNHVVSTSGSNEVSQSINLNNKSFFIPLPYIAT